MDALSYDGYTSYSDSSAPRTPSPHEGEYLAYAGNEKPTVVDESVVVRGLFKDEDAGNGVPVQPEYFPRPSQQQHQQAPTSSGQNLLQQLYEGGGNNGGEWQQQQGHSPHMMRRATYPYARQQDQQRPDAYYQQQQQVPMYHQQQPHPDSHYSHNQRGGYLPPPPPPHYYSDAPPSPDEQGLIVPTQSPYHHGHHHGHHLPPVSSPMPPPPTMYHPSIPVQHTDDAASKETQYLRRRCFNCHTTEPPSWRRSTLNPGKIVCNKCGLYERTHLRPRPLRFDELRAGSKVRKQGGRGAAASTVNAASGNAGVKKAEPMSRRASVSSANSSTSDWDDNVSVYSSSSSNYSPSLAPSSLSLSRSSSHSPPQNHLDFVSADGIRLPTAGLGGRKKSNSLPAYPSAHVTSSSSWLEPGPALDIVEEPVKLES